MKNMGKLFIGIDPGISGALVALDQDGLFMDWTLMPVVDNRVDGRGVHEFLSAYSEYTPMCALEQVAAMPGQGVSSMFKFGESVGIVRGVIHALKVPLLEVRPRAWQLATCGPIEGSKEKAVAYAMDRYPGLDWPKNKSHRSALADALCMALWLRQRHGEVAA